MSNSASISAAKKRRGGAPPPPMPGIGGGGGGPVMNLPPGLPPNFRQLPPHIQQQLFIQLQQKANAAAAAAAAAASASKVASPNPSMPPAHTPPPHPPPLHQHPNNIQVGGSNNAVNIPGPYTVNSVIHNRAMAEVNGVHMRDLPISASGLPCLPSGAALPPNILFKLHHDELLNMDAILNEHSNKIQMLLNRVDRVGGGGMDAHSQQSSQSSQTSYEHLLNNSEFITKILDNILKNTNLSDIINQIDPIQKENEELRRLLHSQQIALNELSSLVMKLISNGSPLHIDTNGILPGSSYENVDEENHEGNHEEDNDEGEHNARVIEDEHSATSDNTHTHTPMEYSVYIPDVNGHNGENVSDQNGEQLEGYEDNDTGGGSGASNWES
jgi:hypothetical protein